jgi:hypothetical protein
MVGGRSRPCASFQDFADSLLRPIGMRQRCDLAAGDDLARWRTQCGTYGPILGQVIAHDDHQFRLGSGHAEKQVLAPGPFGDGFIHAGKQQRVVIEVIRQIDRIITSFDGGFGDLHNRQLNTRRSRQGAMATLYEATPLRSNLHDRSPHSRA